MNRDPYSAEAEAAQEKWAAIYNPMEDAADYHLSMAREYAAKMLPHVAALQAGKVGAAEGMDWDTDELVAILKIDASATVMDAATRWAEDRDPSGPDTMDAAADAARLLAKELMK